MPKKPRRGERLLEDALDALAKALTESGAPWMVIGGIAIIARGVRRFTTDIDVAVRGDAIGAKKLLGLLKRRGIVPRIRDVLSFAEKNLVLLLRHGPTGVDLDVSFAWSAFEYDALAHSTMTNFGSVRAPMCTPENLVVFKAIAGRPRDLEDAEALLALHPKIDVARARKRVAELSAVRFICRRGRERLYDPERSALVPHDELARSRPRSRPHRGHAGSRGELRVRLRHVERWPGRRWHSAGRGLPR